MIETKASNIEYSINDIIANPSNDNISNQTFPSTDLLDEKSSETISFKMTNKTFGSTKDSPLFPAFSNYHFNLGFSSNADDKNPLVANMTEERYPTSTYTIQTIPNISQNNIYNNNNFKENDNSNNVGDKRKLLSTISGVFSPVALSMFSVLLFLRLGFVVGQAGLAQSIMLYMLTYFILLTT
ncbi:unnamed protein product, partial [Gordionus sp. m RMFG-2023]